LTALAIINGVAIVVLVLVTGYYAWQAKRTADEMRSARLLSLLPKLVLDIEMIGPTYGDVVVRNVGPGAAIDADLTLIFEGSEAAGREEREWLAHVIAPGEDHEFLPAHGIGGMDDLVAKHRRSRSRERSVTLSVRRTSSTSGSTWPSSGAALRTRMSAG